MDNIKKLSNESKYKSLHIGNDNKVICEVIHLDTEFPNIKVGIKAGENGSILFNKVCDTLGGILEKDYFGLKYIDKHGQNQWLELNRSISKQIKSKSHGTWIQLFSFRFKHYPRDPINDLRQDLSKYLLYLQLRQDLYSGRLVAPQPGQYRLVALILQAESEGYDMLDAVKIPLPELKILPKITKKDEINIITTYETIKDLEAYEAEKIFLEEASMFDTYGVERVAVKDQKENDLFVGIDCDGVSTFTDAKKMHTFTWNNIIKLSFTHKLFTCKVIVEKKKHILGFKCESSHAACALWKLALDRQWFITLDRASEAKRIRSGGSFFRRQKSHTFSGRSQRELTTNCQTLERIPQPQVIRTHSSMTLLKCFNSRSESANVNENLPSLGSTGYSTLPLSREEPSFFSEFNDDGELSKKDTKESYLESQTSAEAFDAVLDFMEVLRESPRPESLKNSDTEMNIQELDNSSGEYERNNLNDESNLFSEMIEIVERERENLSTCSPPDVNSSDAINITKRNDFDKVSENKDHNSKLSHVSLSVFIICASIVFGIARFLYIRGL